MFKAIKEVGWMRILKYLLFGIWDFVFQLLPYSPLRVLWLKLGGAEIGKDSVIDRIEFTNLDRRGLSGLKIGKECYLGIGVLLDLAEKIVIANQVTVAARSIILTHHSVGFDNHPLISVYPKLVKKTTIEAGSVIGVNSIIFPGVTIGSNSLIGAGSLVRDSVPENVMVAGVPAQVKKQLK